MINAENEKAAAIKAINEKSNFELSNIERSLANDILQIKGSARDRDLQEQKEYYEELKRIAAEFAAKEKSDLEKRYADLNNVQGQARARQLASAAFGFANQQGEEVDDAAGGQISGLASNRSYRRFLQERADIQRAADLTEIRTRIERLTALRDLQKKNGEDTLELDRQVAEARAELAAKQIEPLEAEAKKRQELNRQLLDEGINAFGALVSAGFQNRINELTEEIRLIEERKRAEIEAINATALSEEEKAARIFNVNQRAAAQREQLELRQKQIAERQARFQKAVDILNIITSTARAIMAVYADLTIPVTAKPGLAAIAGAIGAVQLATVIATPIPKYKHGIYGENAHPGGKAILNDGGKREVVVEPGKLPYLQTGVSELVDLAAGTQVYPDLETFAGFNRHAIGDLQVKTNGVLEVLTRRQNDLATEQNRHLKAIAKAVKSNGNATQGARTISVRSENKQITYLSTALS